MYRKLLKKIINGKVDVKKLKRKLQSGQNNNSETFYNPTQLFGLGGNNMGDADAGWATTGMMLATQLIPNIKDIWDTRKKIDHLKKVIEGKEDIIRTLKQQNDEILENINTKGNELEIIKDKLFSTLEQRLSILYDKFKTGEEDEIQKRLNDVFKEKEVEEDAQHIEQDQSTESLNDDNRKLKIIDIKLAKKQNSKFLDKSHKKRLIQVIKRLIYKFVFL